MADKIVLTVLDGDSKGQEYVFDGPRSCVIGRASDCDLKVPPTDLDWMISRHHCQLGIEPQCVWVRDLGSLNGTYVNDLKIGQRHSLVPAEDAPEFVELPQYSLNDGDRLRVGALTFRVSVSKNNWERGAAHQHEPTNCGVRC